ncbi:hypothetical protein ACSBL2_10605 [Pedobacter sp. AW31-3R]|uniref:hypothetical protein n=1 Tax=Pedobacter sp. AW31-3R TaxID=3445781 RepID=UPI003F9F47E3
MKLFPAVWIIAVMAVSCKPTSDYKAERDEVMKIHDVVMADNGVLVANEMKADSLLKDLPGLKKKYPDLDIEAEKAALNATLQRLKNAEDRMNDWMHNFEPDVTGKSDEDAVQYFRNEKVNIQKLDSMYKMEIKSSNATLAKFRK